MNLNIEFFFIYIQNNPLKHTLHFEVSNFSIYLGSELEYYFQNKL